MQCVTPFFPLSLHSLSFFAPDPAFPVSSSLFSLLPLVTELFNPDRLELPYPACVSHTDMLRRSRSRRNNDNVWIDHFSLSLSLTHYLRFCGKGTSMPSYKNKDCCCCFFLCLCSGAQSSSSRPLVSPSFLVLRSPGFFTTRTFNKQESSVFLRTKRRQRIVPRLMITDALCNHVLHEIQDPVCEGNCMTL